MQASSGHFRSAQTHPEQCRMKSRLFSPVLKISFNKESFKALLIEKAQIINRIRSGPPFGLPVRPWPFKQQRTGYMNLLEGDQIGGYRQAYLVRNVIFPMMNLISTLFSSPSDLALFSRRLRGFLQNMRRPCRDPKKTIFGVRF